MTNGCGDDLIKSLVASPRHLMTETLSAIESTHPAKASQNALLAMLLTLPNAERGRRSAATEGEVEASRGRVLCHAASGSSLRVYARYGDSPVAIYKLWVYIRGSRSGRSLCQPERFFTQAQWSTEVCFARCATCACRDGKEKIKLTEKVNPSRGGLAEHSDHEMQFKG